MNKAFVREPDDTGQLHCPVCDSLGIAVARETWQAQLREGSEVSLAETAFYCPFGRCDVAYFDMFERRVMTEELRHAVYPKDPAAPICGCFGLTAEDIEADVREGGVRRVRELLAQAKSTAAHCRTMSASGQPCVSEVQRYYMKLRGGT
ncbi:MAG TPA: hypothetical protein VHV08_13765 [Pirellulales bacterium]|jgi:hypothetical protein|nr:hypothetical protein [Pirellulales bacterium]